MCLSPKECFGISSSRINSAKSSHWASALRGRKLPSWGQLMMGVVSSLDSQRHMRGHLLNLKISDPTEAALSFQKHISVAQEDERETLAHTSALSGLC